MSGEARKRCVNDEGGVQEVVGRVRDGFQSGGVCFIYVVNCRIGISR